MTGMRPAVRFKLFLLLQQPHLVQGIKTFFKGWRTPLFQGGEQAHQRHHPFPVLVSLQRTRHVRHKAEAQDPCPMHPGQFNGLRTVFRRRMGVVQDHILIRFQGLQQHGGSLPV